MKTYLATLLILIILFCSCQKGFTVENSNTELVQNLDSNTLVKYIEFDTTQISGLDTLDIAKYSYDNLKRLALLEYTEFDGAGVKVNLYKTNLFYNGVDSFPFKRIDSRFALPSLSLMASDTNYYSYSNGRIVSDSASDDVIKFTYSTDKIMEKRFTNFPGAAYDSNTYYMTRLNGNLILQVDTTSGGSVYENFSFTYDNKNNPFYRLPISSFESARPFYSLELYHDEMIYEKNNPTQILQTSSVSLFHFKYSYEYNSNGYPKIARVTDQTNPSTFYKVKFFYTAL